MAYGGSAPEYIAFANRETMVIPQFESTALIELLPSGTVIARTQLAVYVALPEGS